MTMKKLNDNDLDISGGNFEIHGWEYGGSVCGKTWQKRKELFTSLKNPNEYKTCTNCKCDEKLYCYTTAYHIYDQLKRMTEVIDYVSDYGNQFIHQVI